MIKSSAVRETAPPAYLAQAVDPSSVLTKATLRAADILEIPRATLADIIGVSPATVTRAAQGSGKIEPASKAGELAALWLRVYRSLDAIVGSNDEAARAWLRSPNTAFADQIPLDRLRSAEGLFHVLHYLDSARARL